MEEKELKEEILNIKKETIEEVFLLFYYAYKNYFKCLVKFGFSHKITQKNKEVFKEFMQNIKEENKYLNLLLKNRKNINIAEAFELLDKLDEQNDQTISFYFYYEYIECLEDAYELEAEHRIASPIKNFPTLVETDAFRKEIARILLGENVKEKYFTYPKEFWEYLKPRMTILTREVEEEISFYGVYTKIDNENCLRDIKVYVPEDRDLKTLLIMIQEINLAFVLYERLNEPFLDLDYEKMAKEEEQNFLETYFEPHYKRIFKSNRM